MAKTLKLITNSSGDWTIAYLNDKRIAEGHDGWSELLADLCSELDIQIIQEEISDKEMEIRCFGESR